MVFGLNKVETSSNCIKFLSFYKDLAKSCPTKYESINYIFRSAFVISTISIAIFVTFNAIILDGINIGYRTFFNFKGTENMSTVLTKIKHFIKNNKAIVRATSIVLTSVCIYLIWAKFSFKPQEVTLNNLKSLKTTDDKYQYVYLVRHGESVFNLPDKNGIYRTQGQSIHASLTKNGKDQALKISEILKNKIPKNANVTVASSTALRASDTADSIFKSLSKKCNTNWGGKYSDLLEVAKGKWEGLLKNDPTYKEELKKWKALSAFDQWITPQVSTSESLSDAANRSAKAVQKLIQKHPDQTLFIVSHGGAMMSLEQLISKVKLSTSSSSNFPKFKYHNCDMLLLKIPKGKELGQATAEFVIKSGFPNTYK